jgi:hypothetical protein
LQLWLYGHICFFFSFVFFLFCFLFYLKEQGLGFRSIVNQLKTIIIAKLTIFRYEYYAHYRFNKVFVGSNFWKKKIHFLLCFKSWDVTGSECILTGWGFKCGYTGSQIQIKNREYSDRKQYSWITTLMDT